MSVDYKLYWRPEVEPELALDWFASALGLHRTGPRFLAGEAVFLALGVTSPQRRAGVLEDFGIDPAMDLTLALDPNVPEEVYQASTRAVMVAATKFVAEHDLDCVLLLMHDLVMMRREHGLVTLRDEWSGWRTMQIDAALPVPYRREPG
jgi:hypothetical protein